jgi:hypothetical protein
MVESYSAAKVNAEKEFNKAKKALKTGLFQWSPDYYNARKHYENAAKLYLEANMDSQAV